MIVWYVTFLAETDFSKKQEVLSWKCYNALLFVSRSVSEYRHPQEYMQIQLH